MTTQIKHAIQRVAVIGAGVMGAGIAAQAANAGAHVLLLDRAVDGDTAAARSAIAAQALARMQQAGTRGALMSEAAAARIQTGNTDDHIALLAEQDWIVEAIVERLDIKQALYQRIDQVRAPHCMVSSNTSTLPLQRLLEGMSSAFCQHFVVTHFFNPPRFMRLVEFVSTKETDSDGLAALIDFNDRAMGKTVIHCADRPGFIANRLGVYWMQVALQEALALGLSVTEADQIMQQCGFPKTGVFGLWDLCGIDLMPEVTASLSRLLPANDPFQAYATAPALIKQMVDKGLHGRKGAVLQGFYRQQKDAQGNRIREQLNLTTLAYEPLAPLPDWPSMKVPVGDVQALLAQHDKGGLYASRVLSRMIAYAACLVPDVANDIAAVDTAMKLGYNWTYGPFELRDLMGAKACDALVDQQRAQAPAHFGDMPAWLVANRHQAGYEQRQGVGYQRDLQGHWAVVEKAEGIVDWAMIAQQAPRIQAEHYRVWAYHDDLLIFELAAKVNVLNESLLTALEQALDTAIAEQRALIITHRAGVFAAGADLHAFIQAQQTGCLAHFIQRGQHVFQRLEQAPIPVVAAVFGKALGGGVELLMHCHHVQLAAEAQLGLVEAQVGIVPGWGGCKNLLVNAAQQVGAEHAIEHSFGLLKSAHVCHSAQDAQQLGLVSRHSAISMNVERLLGDAVHHARRLKQTAPAQPLPSPDPLTPWQPELPQEYSGFQATLEQQLLVLLNRATVPDWYAQFSQWELETDLVLAADAGSQARMQHLLTTGKPLRN